MGDVRWEVMRPGRQDLVAAVLVALRLTLAASLFDMGGWDPLGSCGSASTPRRGFVEADLPGVHLAPGWGHDGAANCVLASVFPDFASRGHLDSVTYRAAHRLSRGAVAASTACRSPSACGPSTCWPWRAPWRWSPR
ncbi:MAG: hypothetical protein R2695_15355 [Acidimicrobiales bacterium]